MKHRCPSSLQALLLAFALLSCVASAYAGDEKDSYSDSYSKDWKHKTCSTCTSQANCLKFKKYCKVGYNGKFGCQVCMVRDHDDACEKDDRDDFGYACIGEFAEVRSNVYRLVSIPCARGLSAYSLLLAPAAPGRRSCNCFVVVLVDWCFLYCCSLG
jgi:hypothetical protein